MMNAMKWMHTVAACALALGLNAAASAQDRATLEEAKVMAEQAAAHVKKVGPDQAFKDFNDQSSATWKKKDLYVFAYNMKGDCVAHGANAQLVGKNQLELKDPTGKPVVRELIDAAKSGAPRVDYVWPNPMTKQPEPKASYVVKLAGYEGFVGVGAYR
jgi:cytochrome c